MVFQINGVDISTYIQDSGLEWQRNDLDGPNAGRTLTGLLIRDRVAVKATFKVTCRPLTGAQLSTILSLIAPEWVTVTYTDPITNTVVTKTMYSNNIPATLPGTGGTYGHLSHEFVIQNDIRSSMLASGYSESMTFSFESPKVFDKMLLPKDDALRQCITILNPLGEDYSVMRTSLFNGLMTSLATNYNKRNKQAALFELSNIYIPKALPLTELPDERMTLAFGFYGDGDFYTLKGTLEELLYKLGLKGIREYTTDSLRPFLHPGRQATVLQNKKPIAYLGEVHPTVADNYGIGTRVYVAFVDAAALFAIANPAKKFTEIPKYPAVTRDLSLLMKKGTLAGEVESIISKNGGRLLEHLELFDIYEGDRIGEGFKSLAYSLVFRAKDHTLSDDEVNPIMEKIIAKLSEKEIDLRS